MKHQTFTLFAFGILLPVDLFGWYAALVTPAAAALFTVAVLVIMTASVALHELGHAVACVAGRRQLYEIRIGMGPRILGVGRFVLDLVPWAGGRVLHATTRPLATRCISAAGPLTNAAVALAAWVTSVPWRWEIVAVNAYFAVTNLIPVRTKQGILDGWRVVHGSELPAPVRARPLTADEVAQALARSAGHR